jgi:hypothetical protein
MQNWKTAVLTLAIFALGALAGSLVSAQVFRGRLAGARKTTPAPPPESREWPQRVSDSVRQQVGLSEPQSTAVSSILSRTYEDVQSMRERWRRELRQRMIESDRAIEKQLTDAQRKPWEDFRKRRRSDFFNQRPQPPRPNRQENSQPKADPGTTPTPAADSPAP